MLSYSMMSVGLALLSGLGSPVQDSVAIHFAPAEGLVVKKRWNQAHQLTLQLMSTQMGKADPVKVKVTGRLESKQVLETTDEYVRSADNRPARLRRSFDELSVAGSMNLSTVEGNFERQAELHSKLQGLGVQYSWVPEDQNYGKFYFAKDGREGDLAQLSEDFDLRCVLPEGDALVGSSWSVDPARLVDLLAPCGEVRLRPTERMDLSLARGMRNGMGGGLETAFGGRMARASFKVTLKEVRQEQGERVAVLELVFRGNFLNEQTEFKVEDVLPREAIRGARYDRRQISLELDGRGEVLWSLDQGRALSMNLACTQSASLKIIEKLSDGQDLVQTLSMRGSLATSFTTELVTGK